MAGLGGGLEEGGWRGVVGGGAGRGVALFWRSVCASETSLSGKATAS